ncbi:MAG: universal stress protein [Anaerolineales bacterium]|nr:universal stress protein [Anaerolineales bacterium]
MYKKILVPMDGSARAEAILPHVEGLAACTGATLVLLHIIDPPLTLVSPYDVMPSLSMEDLQEQKRQVESYLETVQKRLQGKGITTECLTEYGAVVTTIIEIAVRENVDLIAMASHGRTGLSRVFYGSVAAGILHQVDRPLLLVRA